MEDFFRNGLKQIIEVVKEEVNLQHTQINELIENEEKKLEPINNHINKVTEIVNKLSLEELKSLNWFFQYYEEYINMLHRTEEEELEYIKNIAEGRNESEFIEIGFEN